MCSERKTRICLIISLQFSISFVRGLFEVGKKKIWCHQVEILCIAEKSCCNDSAGISLDAEAIYLVVLEIIFFLIAYVICCC